jgi:glycosyltransferase involved in cell wall biosynthesis
LISVILPVYNAQEYLAEAIESILAQTYQNFEFIIINDGSSDNSLNIIKSFNDDRIHLIDRKNMGLVYSLNEALSIANGKYIARMDADDISLPDRFEKQLFLMENNLLDICGSHYLLIDANNKINGLNLTPLSHDFCFLSLISKVPFAHPSVMIRKDFLLKYNFLYGSSKYKIAEDLDLWIRMYNAGAKFANLNEIVFKYRIIENSLSKINRLMILKETKEMQKEFLKEYEEKFMNIIKTVKIDKLNVEEQDILVRAIIRIVLKNFNFSLFKYLKSISKKIVICSILSEIINR